MSQKPHIELDSEGRPLVSTYCEFAERYLTESLLLFFFSVPLSVGLSWADVIVKSPLVYYTGMASGFVASVIAWIPAFFVGGVVFGQFEFAKEVFSLYSDTTFRVVTGLITLFIPLGGIVQRIVRRAVISYSVRAFVFTLAIGVSVIAGVKAINLLASLEDGMVYGFGYLSLWVVHFFTLRLLWTGRSGRVGNMGQAQADADNRQATPEDNLWT